MIHASVYLLLITFASVKNEQEASPDYRDPVDPLLNGEGIDDNELWDLLKKGGRSGSDQPDDTAYDYGDYLDLDENVVRFSTRENQPFTPSVKSYQTTPRSRNPLTSSSEISISNITKAGSKDKSFTTASNVIYSSPKEVSEVDLTEYDLNLIYSTDSQTVKSNEVILGTTLSTDEVGKPELLTSNEPFSTIESKIIQPSHETYSDFQETTYRTILNVTSSDIQETTYFSKNTHEIVEEAEVKAPSATNGYNYYDKSHSTGLIDLTSTINSIASEDFLNNGSTNIIYDTEELPSTTALPDKEGSKSFSIFPYPDESQTTTSALPHDEASPSTTTFPNVEVSLSTITPPDEEGSPSTTLLPDKEGPTLSTSLSDDKEKSSSYSTPIETEGFSSTITLPDSERLTSATTFPNAEVSLSTVTPPDEEGSPSTTALPDKEGSTSFSIFPCPDGSQTTSALPDDEASPSTTTFPNAEVSLSTITPPDEEGSPSTTSLPDKDGSTSFSIFPYPDGSQTTTSALPDDGASPSTTTFPNAEVSLSTITPPDEEGSPSTTALPDKEGLLLSTTLSVGTKTTQIYTEKLATNVTEKIFLSSERNKYSEIELTQSETSPSSQPTSTLKIPQILRSTSLLGSSWPPSTTENITTVIKLSSKSEEKNIPMKTKTIEFSTNLSPKIEGTTITSKESIALSKSDITSKLPKTATTSREASPTTALPDTRKETSCKESVLCTKMKSSGTSKPTTTNETMVKLPSDKQSPTNKKFTTKTPVTSKPTVSPKKKKTSKPIFHHKKVAVVKPSTFDMNRMHLTTPGPLKSPLSPHVSMNKLDPRKISMVEHEFESITERFFPHFNSGQHSQTKKPTNINIFDSKKLFMIDEVTSPTTILNKPSNVNCPGKKATEKASTPRKSNFDVRKKTFIPTEEEDVTEISRSVNSQQSKFDPSRVFVITDEKTHVTPVKNPSIIKNVDPRVRPAVSLSLNITNPSINIRQEVETVKSRFAGVESVNVGVGSKMPELICIQVLGQDMKVRLRCLEANPNVRRNSRPVYIDLRTRNPLQSNGYRRIFFQNKNRYALVRGVPPQGSSLSRHPSQVPPPLHFQIGIQRPQNRVQIVNSRSFGGEESPTSYNRRGVFVMEAPPEQSQRYPNYEERRHFLHVSNRMKRSAASYCNPDIDVSNELGRTLTIVFDDTGSMSSELHQMREVAKEIVFQMASLKKDLIKDYVLVTFNDPGVSLPFCTTSYTTFIEELNEIYVVPGSGGDCPEKCLTGLSRALAVSRRESFVFVITDANPKDAHLEEEIMNLLGRKRPSIFFLLTGNCESGVSPEYANISKSSSLGGIYQNMDKSGVKEMLEVIYENFVKKDLVSLKKTYNPRPAKVPYGVSVPSDSSVTRLTVSVTGNNPGLNLTSPEGDTSVGEKKTFKSTVIINVERPTPGIWKANVSSSSAHSLSAIGTSSIKFLVGFSVLPTNKISETSHRPLKGGENYILVEVSNPEKVKNITAIEMFSPSGEHFLSIDLEKLSNGNTLYRGGPFIPPNDYFNMKMHGIDKAGTPITRLSPSAISPQLPKLPYVTMLSRMTVEAGKPLVIRCHAESLVAVNLKLYKISKSGFSKTKAFKQTSDIFLEIESASPRDEGIYRCWAKNIAGEETKDINVTVTVKPPLVIVKPEIFFKRNSRAEIMCSTVSPVEYSVQWMKDISGRFVLLQNSSRTHALYETLIIENPTEADEGWYQCLSKNSGGESKGLSYLKMSLLPSITISASRHFRSGFNLSIICSVTGIPPPEITWLKNGQNFESGGQARVKMVKEEIYIFNAVKEDQATYTCTASNLAGKVTRDTEFIYEELPKVKSPQKEVEVLIGEDILLECEASGVPVPKVHWKKDAISISQESFLNYTVLSDNSLLIRPSSMIHNGIYICSAHNEIGSDELSIEVRVKGIIPQIVEPPEDIYIDIGGNGKLSCIATGHPAPTISWKRSDKSIHATAFLSSLEFKNASLYDGGKYWCIAENVLGRKESAAEVHVIGGVSPIINKNKEIEELKVLVGDKAELTCTITSGKPHPNIVWFKNGSKLSGSIGNGIHLDNGSYFISTIDPSDSGIYECLAVNELGSDSKKIVLKLYEPPRIDTKSSSNVVATVGKSSKLICDVSGDPKPNVTWKHYSHTDRKIMNGVILKDSHDLYFDKVTEEDNGRYICRAENIAGIARRPYALYVMVPPNILPWPVEKFVEVGNIVTLECRIRAIPRPSVIWLKDNSTVPRTKYYGQFMRFYANANDSGTYSCIAENKAGRDRVETNLIVLVPPQISEGPLSIKVVCGKEAILPCEVSGNPQPSISWQWNGELIKKGSGSDFGTLHIINTTEADAGTYICIAQNKAGISKKKIDLIILTPPKILSWTEPVKVILEEFVNVTCQHFANPEATITWFKDKIPFRTDHKNRLEFYATPSHKGVYTCVAKNEAGIDSKDFTLVILDPPTFAKIQPFSFDVLKGKNVDISCVAFGDPKPIMGWNRSGEVLTSDSRRSINSETGLLTIFSASEDDEGYYNCTAKNRAGEVWRTVEINVLELPKAQLEVSNDLVKEETEVEFTCIASGKPFPKIFWKKDGVVLSTENDKNLRFIAFRKDQGNYTCVVQNSVGENFSSLHLNVSVLPVFNGPLEERFVKLEGDEILLNCSAEGIPPPNIFWYFNETLLEKYGLDFAIVNNTHLKLLTISRDRDGWFTCEAKNFAGSVKKKIRLYVHVKPSIVDQFETQITLIEGKDLALQCNAYGIPAPKIMWMKNDSVLPQAESRNSLPVSSYENFLLIFNANNNSIGLYTCKAENEEGVAKRIYNISVIVPKVPVKPGVEYVNIAVTGGAIIKCDAIPGSEIIWLKDNQTLKSMSLERGDDVHFIVGSGGQTLKLTEMFPDDSGMFSCYATHPEGNSTKSFFVDVLVPPNFIDYFPQTEFTVMENKSLILECPLQGNPPPIVNWRLALGNIPVNEYTVPGVYPYGDNGDSLIFRSVKPFHTGLYVCSGTNKIGEESRSYSVKVVGPPKRIGPELTNMDIVSGRQLELNCSVEGSPQPTLKWSLLSRSGEEKVLKYESRNIRIGNIQIEDDGLYNCSASNPYGNIFKMFNISVYVTPRIKREADNKIILAMGEDLYLTCLSNVEKSLSIKWFFNNEKLNSSDRMSVISSPDTKETKFIYLVPNVNKTSEGLYKCTLSNLAGSDQREFEVIVIAPPKIALNRTNEKVQTNIGIPIKLECPLQSENDIKFVWKKNGVILPASENSTLNILSSTVNDEGNYTCIGSNLAGMVAIKFEVTILVAPNLIGPDHDLNITIPLEESLKLNCSVFGNPKPEILWIKNLKQIDESLFPQILLSNDNQILKIDEVDTTDGGKYSCFPSNIAGSTEKHFEIQILEPPSVEIKNKSQRTFEKIITTDVYKRAVLRCPLSGSPEPEISWFKGSDEIKENDVRFKVSIDKKILIVNHADESTAGIFKCNGKNEIGNTTFIFHFHIRIPMQWGQWSKWAECTVSCGGGTQLRSRECLGDRNDIFSDYIHLFNASCSGLNIETQACNEQLCPVNGGWGNWSEWGSCSSSCGAGWKRRTRRCNNPLPANEGLDCPGETYEDHPCESVPCPINGNWGEWSDWSECSASCGLSMKIRTRRCNNPAPSHGGLPCLGRSRDPEFCRKRRCPADDRLGWSSWSQWSPCSATCGTGIQWKFRTCLLEAHGGQCTPASKQQSRLCKTAIPCIRKRYPRHAELKIEGELNNQKVEESLEAEIINDENGTSTFTFSKHLLGNETFSYLPFTMGPLSWLFAQEDDKAKNGFSLTNGSFHEKSTYYFSTGEEMEMQSDAQNSDSKDILKLDIKLKGNTPTSPVASIVIDPYAEDIVQRERDKITTSSNVSLNTGGRNFPVSVRKTVQFSSDRLPRISPVEKLISEGSRSDFDKESNQLYFHSSFPVISSRMLRNACPKGFKYDLESGECIDINECRRRGLNSCQPSQICINTLGSYNCECRKGFTVSPNRFGCKDINECQEGIHSCSHRCINTRGSYQCICPKHLILAEDMHNCVETSDEYYNYETDSMENPMNISYLNPVSSSRTGKTLGFEDVPNYEQQDQNKFRESLSSFSLKQLSCPAGFKPGENGCEDLDECTDDENPCLREQICLNTLGSFVCIETPCPDHFVLSQETRSCVLHCTEEEGYCTDGAILSESLQIITVPVYKGNYTFHPFTTILEMTSYDNNDLPLRGCIYEIVQNEAGLPVAITTEKTLGILFALKYFEVIKEERLVIMSSKYDISGSKLHSTMFVVYIYNANKIRIE